MSYLSKILLSYGTRKKIKNFWENLTPFDLFRGYLFREIKNPVLQFLITKRYLDFIEIEIFSYCNRRCWFCPNSYIDRHSSNIFMEEETYLNVMKQLKKINYKGIITYSRYNEPLSDKIFLTRIKQARQALPHAFLYTHSNGDYITPEYLDELADAGLDFIRLQCYLNEDEEFDIENVVLPKLEKLAKRLDLPYKVSTSKPDHVELMFEHPRIKVLWEANDFRGERGVNRGESVDGLMEYHRTSPCSSPFRRMYIDYDGSVMPCCQVRHDIEKHKKMIMGNVSKESMYKIFTGEGFASIRKHLQKEGEKMHPCSTCTATRTKNVFCDEAVLFSKRMIKRYKLEKKK